MRSESGGLTAFYVFDGTTLLGEVSGVDNRVQAAYTWGAEGLVSEHLVGSGYYGSNPEKSLWYGFGPQGETRRLTDSAGAVADTYSYTAYGRQVSSSGSDANAFRYGGQWGYYTGPSGASTLILCGLRWYDPAMGRFISRDPIGYDGGENLYAYCEQDPANLTDPSGLQSATNRHHSYPTAYGGDRNQPLTTMPRDEHVQLHRDMQDFMKGKTNAAGDNMQWRSNNSGEQIRGNFTRPEREDALGDFYRRHRRRYPNAARDFFRQCPAQAPSRLANKVGGRLARRILKCAAKKVPVLNVGFFLYDWYDGGIAHAANEATWPVSVLWNGK